MTDSEKLDLLIDKVGKIESDLSEVKHRVTKIELTLENEIDRNIKIIAEGHLDLSRKLNESIKIASDIQAKQEVQDLYISSHETRLKAL